MLETWIFRLLVLVALGLFGWQMATRYRLFVRAPTNIDLSNLGARVRAFVAEVVFQTRTIRERPIVGVAHLFVFWGFCAFGGYTAIEGFKGLGVADLTDTRAFDLYRLLLLPFSAAVLMGIVALFVRRAFLRPAALGARVSKESLLISAFIAALMITFLVDFVHARGLWVIDSAAERVNWWVHMLVILTFTVLIPGSKHLHLLLSPIAVFLRSPVLGAVPRLDFDKEEVGIETVGQLPRKQVLDAFTCVECGRCQDSCPAFATGKLLNPKKLILQNEDALLAGELDRKLVDVYDEGVLWQCTTCGACQNQCPVGIEHLPNIIGARRGLVSNGEAPEFLGPVYTNLERRGNIWGLLYEQRQKFIASAGVETFDPAKHDYVVWLGCAGAFEADFQKSLRALFDILRAKGVTFGVLAKERCNGDVAKRTGNEYMFQELAGQNVEELNRAGVKKVVTSCPHCLKTLGDDYREFGFEAEVVHSASLVEQLTRGVSMPKRQTVTYHDPCYLGRYAGQVDEPRALLERFGGEVAEPVRNRTNPFCCGAGGGLLFEEHEQGKRISQERFDQLQATGAGTIVMACPFCSIMLKGARASSNSQVEMTDVISFVASASVAAPVPGTVKDVKPNSHSPTP
jgi:Fe-S oxidoreductase